MLLKYLPHITNRLSIRIVAFSAAVVAFFPVYAQAQCDLHPIALSAQTLAGVTEGSTISDIWNGQNPGNFGWLSWTGDPGEPTLVDSLAPAGDSNTYVNPDDPNDHQVDVGDWVSGKPGVTNGKHVRAALDKLIAEPRVIIVPVWDEVRGTGSNVAYHVVAFAMVQLTSYSLPSRNKISAIFIGYASCGGGGVS